MHFIFKFYIFACTSYSSFTAGLEGQLLQVCPILVEATGSRVLGEGEEQGWQGRGGARSAGRQKGAPPAGARGAAKFVTLTVGLEHTFMSSFEICTTQATFSVGGFTVTLGN